MKKIGKPNIKPSGSLPSMVSSTKIRIFPSSKTRKEFTSAEDRILIISRILVNTKS